MIPIPQEITTADGRALAVGNTIVGLLRRLSEVAPSQWAALAVVQGGREGEHPTDVLQRMARDLQSYADDLHTFAGAAPRAIVAYRHEVGALDRRARARLHIASTRAKLATDRLNHYVENGAHDTSMSRAGTLAAAGLSPAEVARVMGAAGSSNADRR